MRVSATVSRNVSTSRAVSPFGFKYPFGMASRDCPSGASPVAPRCSLDHSNLIYSVTALVINTKERAEFQCAFMNKDWWFAGSRSGWHAVCPVALGELPLPRCSSR